MDASAKGADLKARLALFGELDDLDGVLELFAPRIDDRIFAPIDSVPKAAAAAMFLIPDLEARDLIADGRARIGAEAGEGALLGDDLVSAITIMAVADGAARHLADKEIAVIPSVNVAMSIGQMPAREEQEAVPRVAESLLEMPPHRMRDEIGRDARVAIMRDARDELIFGTRRADERSIKRGEAAPVGIFDKMRDPAHLIVLDRERGDGRLFTLFGRAWFLSRRSSRRIALKIGRDRFTKIFRQAI